MSTPQTTESGQDAQRPSTPYGMQGTASHASSDGFSLGLKSLLFVFQQRVCLS